MLDASQLASYTLVAELEVLASFGCWILLVFGLVIEWNFRAFALAFLWFFWVSFMLRRCTSSLVLVLGVFLGSSL